jgi:uncharacterized protein (DUF1501 family)
MNRKTFIKNGSGVIVTGLIGNAISTSCSSKSIYPKYDGKRLIIIRLDGGHDGLFAFLPAKNEHIAKRRPDLFKRTIEKGIAYENSWVLHQNLSIIDELSQKNQAKLIPFLGYPEPNTSHFKSAEIWETGVLPQEGKELKEGWIGKYLTRTNIDKTNLHYPVIALHENKTLFDKTKEHEAFTWLDKSLSHQYLDEIPPLLELLEKTQNHSIQDYIKKQLENQLTQMKWLSQIEPKRTNYTSDLNRQLSWASELINKDYPYKIIHTHLEGFDTHLDQPQRLEELYLDLNHSLSKFILSIKHSHWTNTCIWIYSEFGRTIDENKNHGTDHGFGGLGMILSGDESFLKSINIQTDIENSFDNSFKVYAPVLNDFRTVYEQLAAFISA